MGLPRCRGQVAARERAAATWPGTASWRSYFGDRRQAPADRHQTSPPPPRSSHLLKIASLCILGRTMSNFCRVRATTCRLFGPPSTTLYLCLGDITLRLRRLRSTYSFRRAQTPLSIGTTTKNKLRTMNTRSCLKVWTDMYLTNMLLTMKHFYLNSLLCALYTSIGRIINNSSSYLVVASLG